MARAPIRWDDADEPAPVAVAPGERLTPRIYWIVVLVAMALASLFHLRTGSIFACPAAGYGPGHYLGACPVATYGDYDSGALWFDLEPEARKGAAAADLLLIGNGGMAFGFPGPALREWAAAHDLKPYLLAFAGEETVDFLDPLLRSIRPRASAVVVDVEGLFRHRLTPTAADLMHAPDARSRYERKADWQDTHREICGWFPMLCGGAVAFFRDASTGGWTAEGTMDGWLPVEAAAVGPELPPDGEGFARQLSIARQFLATLGVRKDCVFLTYVPGTINHRATAALLAEQLGYVFISPRLPEARTFDGTHLDPGSARAFTRAFLAEAGPAIETCVNGVVQ